MLSPVEAVFMECSVHGVQVVNLSGVIRQDAGTVIFSSTSRTPCPRCGRLGAIIPGSYIKDSQSSPVRAVLDLTPQQAKSIQFMLTPAVNALANTKYSDQQAYAVFDRRLERLENVNGDLVEEVRELRTKLSRKKFVSFLLGLVFALGLISDVGGAWQTVTHVVQWAAAVYDTGRVPHVPDIPPEFRPPDGRRTGFGLHK
jgi:hypothetical protein